MFSGELRNSSSISSCLSHITLNPHLTITKSAIQAVHSSYLVCICIHRLTLHTMPDFTAQFVPSNTLMITGLDNWCLSHQESLAVVRSCIEDVAPLKSFSPLPLPGRVICSFSDVEDAVRVRQHLATLADTGALDSGGDFDSTKTNLRVYFGGQTPVSGEEAEAGQQLNRHDFYNQGPVSDEILITSPSPNAAGDRPPRDECLPSSSSEAHVNDLLDDLGDLKLGPVRQTANTDTLAYNCLADGDDEHDDIVMDSATEHNAQVSTSHPESTGNRPLGDPDVKGNATLIYNPATSASKLDYDLPVVMVEDTSMTDAQSEEESQRPPQ